MRCALEAHGVDHAAVVAGVNSIRRRLLLGENDFVVVCIALDEPTLARHGEALRRLLSDHRCFPTKVRTVGLLSDLGLNRQVAELGCNVYVDDSTHAAAVIRLLADDALPAEAGRKERPVAPATRWSIRSRWLFGSPELPAELASLVGVKPATNRANGSRRLFSPGPVDGPGGDFGDRLGPP
ncbi:MAG: hypothetical protein ACYS15_05845 [Planctomycetota bacterium]